MASKQTVAIVLTILFMAAIIALVLGLSLGLRKKTTSSDKYSTFVKERRGDALEGSHGNGQGTDRGTGQGTDHGTGQGTDQGTGQGTDQGTGQGTGHGNDRKQSQAKTARTFGEFQHLTVQSDNRICSRIGTSVLVLKSGTAVDAAVATVLCLGVVNPQSLGIGGGIFMVVYDVPIGSNDKTVEVITAREVLPSAGNKNTFKNVSSVYGGVAVGVPGEVKGLHAAWQKFGRVPWKELLEPSVRLATDGFVIDGALAKIIEDRQDRIRRNPGLRELFVKSGAFSTIYREGDILRRPKYGETLRRIGEDPFSFYTGSLADDIVADIKDAGGIITKNDLLDYTAKVKPPVKGRLDRARLTMYSPQPPSGGVVLQAMLRVIDGLNLTLSNVSTKAKATATYHHIVETFKWAYAKRTALGDPDFVNIAEVIRNLTSKKGIDDARMKIDPKRTHPTEYYNPAFEVAKDSGTSHVNVLAPHGGAVALTASINTYFGSEVRGSRTGIIFNNEMDDFSVPGKVNSWGLSPSPSNYPEPGKMPMSSMSPSIFLADDGNVAYMSGAEGGSRIISSVAYVALHNLYLGQSLKDATDMRRLHHQLLPDEISYEDGFDKDILKGLEELGHKIKLAGHGLSVVGTIRNVCANTCRPRECPESCIHAVSDERKAGGAPSGF